MTTTPKPLSEMTLEALEHDCLLRAELLRRAKQLQAENAELRAQAKPKPLPENASPDECKAVTIWPDTSPPSAAWIHLSAFHVWYKQFRTRYGQPTGPSFEQAWEVITGCPLINPNVEHVRLRRDRWNERQAAGWPDKEPDAWETLERYLDGRYILGCDNSPSREEAVSILRKLRNERSHE